MLRDGDPDRYERAAVHWLGRFALEARDVTVNAIRGAAEALDDLPDEPAEAMERLQRLCVVHGVSCSAGESSGRSLMRKLPERWHPRCRFPRARV